MPTKVKPFQKYEIVLKDRYVKREALGSGSFGTVYKAYDRKLKQDIALKEEPIYGGHHQLPKEHEVYKSLGNLKGFLHLVDYFHVSNSRYLAFTLVGRCLEDELQYCKGKFDLKTTLMIAFQLIDEIEALHDKGYVHRDIKPDNMAMGLGQDTETLFMLDLGIGKKYMVNGNHRPCDKDGNLVGTARYASLNAHRGYELSRRDDMESIAYVLIYLQLGHLPWQGFQSDFRGNKYDKVKAKKKEITPAKLCRNLRPEFAKFLEETRKLRFEERPNYKGYKKMFMTLFENQKFELDYVYKFTKPTDPAAIRKAKLDEEKRIAAIKAEKRRLKASLARLERKKRFDVAAQQELLFTNNQLNLFQKRQIIRALMVNASFPTLLPPIIPSIDHLTELCNKQKQMDLPNNDMNEDVVEEQEGLQASNDNIKNVLTSIQRLDELDKQKESNNKNIEVEENINENVQIVQGPRSANDSIRVAATNVKQRTEQEEVNVKDTEDLKEGVQEPNGNMKSTEVCSNQKDADIKDIKVPDTTNNDVEIQNLQESTVNLDENKENMEQPTQKNTIPIIAPHKISKSRKKALRRKAKKAREKEKNLEEAKLKPQPLPSERKQSRKEQQADMLALAKLQAQEEEKRKTQKRKYIDIDATTDHTSKKHRRDEDYLPSFNQLLPNFYRPHTTSFNPTFASPQLIPPVHDSERSFFLF